MKKLFTICLDCGREIGSKEKKVFGVWNDTCDRCGRKNVPCASAQHDFGIYNNKAEELQDAI